MTSLRLTNRSNGRDSSGRFAPGCRAGPGNPHARHVANLRGELLRAVKPTDLRAVIAKLVDAAKAGEPWAVRELLDRTLGRPVTTVELAEVDRTEKELPARIVIVVSPDDAKYFNPDRINGDGELEQRPGL